MSRWPSAEPCTDWTVSPWGWPVTDYTCTLRCTDTHSPKGTTLILLLSNLLYLNHSFFANTSHRPTQKYNTHTHLGRLGCGEVKPGRDKVMLRHLGPVFPVSGSRHQTSWPGSNKRHKQHERHFQYCNSKLRKKKSFYIYLSIFDFLTCLLWVFCLPISFFGIHCIKVS